jgi:hypothetical protein
MGYNPVESVENQPRFRRKMSLPFSEPKNMPWRSQHEPGYQAEREPYILQYYNYFISIIIVTTTTTTTTTTKLDYVALVLKRTIPTERPPLVDEVSAKFCE